MKATAEKILHHKSMDVIRTSHARKRADREDAKREDKLWMNKTMEKWQQEKEYCILKPETPEERVQRIKDSMPRPKTREESQRQKMELAVQFQRSKQQEADAKKKKAPMPRFQRLEAERTAKAANAILGYLGQ